MRPSSSGENPRYELPDGEPFGDHGFEVLAEHVADVARELHEIQGSSTECGEVDTRLRGACRGQIERRLSCGNGRIDIGLKQYCLD